MRDKYQKVEGYDLGLPDVIELHRVGLLKAILIYITNRDSSITMSDIPCCTQIETGG